MTQPEYFTEFEQLCNEELELTKLKNGDYAKSEDAFANFRQIEILSGGKISLEAGIFTRMSDKFSRLGTILFQDALVKEETIDDTLKDIAIYSKIWRIYRREKLNSKVQEQHNIAIRDQRKERCGVPIPFHANDILFCTFAVGHNGPHGVQTA